MLKSSSPNSRSTWPIPLCHRNLPAKQTCLHSACSVLAIRMICRVTAVFVFRKSLFIVRMAPMRKGSDAGSASKPKRSRDVLSICEQLKILNISKLKNKKNRFLRLPGCMAGTNFRTVNLWRTKKKYILFFVAPQPAKFGALAPDKLLMVPERPLNFWVADMNIQRVPLFITLYNYCNVGNVLLCVINQWTFTVFTRISRYITLYIAFGIIRFSRKRGRSWNVIPADTGVRLSIDWAWT